MEKKYAHYKKIIEILIFIILIPLIGIIINVTLNFGRIVGTVGRNINSNCFVKEA